MFEKSCKFCATRFSSSTKICPHCGKRQGWTLWMKILIGFFLLVIINGLNGLMHKDNKDKEALITVPSPSSSPKEEALAATKLIKYDWYKGGFDNIMIANFTIENRSKYDIKDIKIKCTHSAMSRSNFIPHPGASFIPHFFWVKF